MFVFNSSSSRVEIKRLLRIETTPDTFNIHKYNENAKYSFTLQQIPQKHT